MSRIVVNSIPFCSQLASHTKCFRDLVENDRRRAQKHHGGRTAAYGPCAAQKKHQGHKNQPPPSKSGGTSGSQPTGSNVDSITVKDATVTYTMPCTMGGQDYNLLIDTGSSNTWCGADQKFTADSSCESTRNSVSVSYGSGSFEGIEYVGDLILGGKGSSMPAIKGQSFGVANTATGFSGTDGILGIGPVDLTNSTVTGMGSIPTITDNLCKQGVISTECIGISYNPTQAGNMANGELMFGGVDKSKMDGDMTYVPITSTSPACKYWGINQQITYGASNKMILPMTCGIVDTGTTLMMISGDAFQAYQQATGATMDNTTGLLKFTPEQYEQLESMFFNIGGTTFEFTPNAQIWPRAFNSALGGDANSIYCIVSSMGQVAPGLDFINGFSWLQRFCVDYDTTNSRVGIATTPNTKAETN